MKKITIASKKGGVSKTTTALMLGLILSEQARTLLIDMDSQNALSDFFFDEYEKIANNTIFEAFKKTIPFKNCIHTVNKNLSVIPSKLEVEEISYIQQTGKEYFLKDELEVIESDFDYCIIDTPPNLNSETVMSLVASDVIIIPARLEKMDTRAINFTLDKIDNQIKKHYNPDVKIFILGTQYNYQNRTINDIALETLQENYSDMLIDFTIPYTSKISMFNYVGYEGKEIKNFNEYKQLMELIK